WSGGHSGERKLLRSAFYKSLNLVRDYEASLLMEVHSAHPEMVSELTSGEKMSEQFTEELNRFIADFTTRYKLAVK
ncbi:MAG: hypothetical protein II161_05380, partial [Erysipelotrichaceae bacterium]|nr:hypothetical protein [Erysipelotrichaceae bacterium]